MQVTQSDYMTQVLRLYMPGDLAHWGHLTARVNATQPSGYAQQFETAVDIRGKHVEVALRYPLMDDGAWEQSNQPKSALSEATPNFEMGTYSFRVQLLSDGSPIVAETVEFDQDQLYANSSTSRLRHDFPPGFIECAPLRTICIDHDEIPISVRLKTERVPTCRIRIDVATRHGVNSLVEPVELDLRDEPQIVTFEHAGWERGEYWIRVQVVEGGQTVGPYMVRKFWKEVIGPDVAPVPPLRIGNSLQYLVDGWLFEEVQGIDFRPMSYDPNPNQPAVVMDKPWEFGAFQMGSLRYDHDEQLYRLEYTCNPMVYRRRGFGWRLLAHDLASEESQRTDQRRGLGSGVRRRIVSVAQRDPVGGGRAEDPLETAYQDMLQRLLVAGTPVQEFNVPPEGCAYAILNDPRPVTERETNHVMLAVPSKNPDDELPFPDDIDESDIQVFAMYPEDLNRPEYVCLATSSDGVHWHKPELGRVEFHGSKANNILGAIEDVIRDAAYEDVTAAITLEATRAEFRFRMYDAARDGPVDMDKVFMALIAQGRNFKIDFMWPDDFASSEDTLGFTPVLRSYYPMLYAGNDEYLFLSDRPLIHLGPGMDLMHSSETIRHQAERLDDHTIFWYYRPSSPGYPPHNMPWDNSQGPLRNLAVMWTDDGVHFHKRFCVTPDEFDPRGMQFYNMGLITELPASFEGRTMLRHSSSPGVAVKRGEMYVAELRCYDGALQRQYPELMWSRDLMHWHRFAHNRAPLVNLGEKDGDYNWGMYFQDLSFYAYKDEHGRDAWWLSNVAVSSRHNHHTVGFRYAALERLQADNPHYSESPFFVDWETLWRRGQQMRYYPFFTHIAPGRLAYATPTNGSGELTTHSMQFDGRALVLNAQVEVGGSIRVEALDADDRPIDGFALDDSTPFAGDAVDYRPEWATRQLAELEGRPVKFRILLDRAKLFTLRIEGDERGAAG